MALWSWSEELRQDGGPLYPCVSLSLNMGRPQEGGVTLMTVSRGALSVVHLKYIQSSFKIFYM